MPDKTVVFEQPLRDGIEPDYWEYQYRTMQPDTWPGPPEIVPAGPADPVTLGQVCWDRCRAEENSLALGEGRMPDEGWIETCGQECSQNGWMATVLIPDEPGWLQVRACGDPGISCSVWSNALTVPDLGFHIAMIVGVLGLVYLGKRFKKGLTSLLSAIL